MTSSTSVDNQQREALCKALLPPLSFARRDDFKFLERLSGVDGLVDSVLEGAPANDPLARALRAAALGFDADTLANKRRRVTRLIALLDGSYTPKAAVPAAATTPKPATKAAAPPRSKAATAPQAEAAAPKRAVPTLQKAKASTDNGDVLTWPLSRLKGVGPLKAAQLHERGLLTVGDVLFTLPRTYEDRREKKRIADVEDGLLTVVSGTVQIAGIVGGGRGRRFEATIDDGTGLLRLVFFHFKQGELMSRLARGNVVTASGEVKKQQGRPTMVHPRLTAGDKATALGGVSAVYPELKGLHPLELGRVAASAVDVITANPPPDPLPPQVVAQVKLPALVDALTSLHKPAADVDPDTLRALVERRSPGHMRLAFEELFVLGTALSLRRLAQGVDPAPPLVHVDGEDDAIKKLLPFSLTGAQRRASSEILADLQRPQPMARLLQGDVGAGKTAVAAVAALRAARAGFQTAFMAPTEILAEQHGRTLKKIGFASGLRVEVLTGSVGKKARALIEARLRNRDIDIIVGTQALLSEGVTFAKLGLCIVDEQHRFGVVQRALLRQKGPVVDGVSLTPHLLVMTATPIPRSLTLTVYGDLSVSILDELPPGRTPIVTKITPDMHAAVEVMRHTLARNERAFVVYPLIDESEKLDVMAASAGFDDLRRTFLRDDGSEDVVLLHGKMPTADKDAAMAAFARGDKRVLVSTTVIEVGVDVPQASLMVIVNAERFGLAQLHQLRGRVGRGAAASTCLLVPGDASHDAIERLQTLEETTDGFRIAEKDLELRGAGDVLGTRQSGLPSLAFSDVVKHARLIETARDLAEGIVVTDPTLSRPEHAGLRRLVHERYADRLALTAAG
jgi:ATP-dependent DNA helicase RecG